MSASRTVICLLRTDLRLHDNELFHWAQRNAEHIVPLYCFDPRHYVGTYNFNMPKTGPFRLRFLLESVRDLRATLLTKGRPTLCGDSQLCGHFAGPHKNNHAIGSFDPKNYPVNFLQVDPSEIGVTEKCVNDSALDHPLMEALLHCNEISGIF